MKFTNRSNKTNEWVGGPTKKFKQIPGYAGHVPGLKADSLCGGTYARLTQTAFDRN